jgi:hypothetical protein
MARNRVCQILCIYAQMIAGAIARKALDVNGDIEGAVLMRQKVRYLCSALQSTFFRL